MKKVTVLKILNPVLGLLLLGQAGSGILHGVLPRDVFEVMHTGGGLALLACAVLHVILNWNWIRTNFFRKRTAGPAA